MIKVSIGQDSHRFAHESTGKKLVLGGVTIDGYPGLEGNSDADVVLHALTNAVSGITGVNILGDVADRMCSQGITDSRAYLEAALGHMKKNSRILHVSISIEALRPKLVPHIERMRMSIAEIMGIDRGSIGITATTGEGLTEFGKGNGIYCTAILTADVPE